jgi:acetyltransferase-like isoleucine patch superfamily enzyme
VDVNIKSALALSVAKSLYLSTRFHGRVVVVRGTRIRLAKGARIELAPGARLRLGMRHPLGAPLSLQIRPGGRLTVHGEVLISSGTRILIGDNAHLEIGDQTFIHYDGVITCWDHISIGSECGISWNVNILDGNGHDLTVGGKARPVARGTQIGDRVWLGTGATVVSATIGDGSVVGAASMVSGKVPSKVLVKGNPATVVREDVLFEGHHFEQGKSGS